MTVNYRDKARDKKTLLDNLLYPFNCGPYHKANKTTIIIIIMRGSKVRGNNLGVGSGIRGTVLRLARKDRVMS